MATSFGPAVVRNAKGTHTATVIYFHGLGATADNIAQLVDSGMLHAGDHIKYVFPNAPVRSVTMSMGMKMPAWFDLPQMGPDMLKNIDWEGHGKALEFMHSLIDAEIKAGIPSDRIIVGGFSQGGNVAMRGGISFREKIAGVLINSSFLGPPINLNASAANAAVPMLWCHGQSDPIIPIPVAQQDQMFLKNSGVAIEGKSYSGLDHSLDPRVLTDMTAFMKACIPAAPAAPAAPPPTPEEVGAMSVKQLKAFIASRGRDPSTCFEKSDLVALAQSLLS